MKFYPIHMHLHAAHEPSASIGTHMYYANKVGIRHIWTTEHDTRMGTKPRALPKFFFPEKKLFCEFDKGIRAGFVDEEGNSGKYSFGECDGKVYLDAVAEGGERESLYFYSKSKNHSDPLFARPTVGMCAELHVMGDARITVEIILSAQPPSCEHAKICYVLGTLPQDEPLVCYLPMPTRDPDGFYRFPVFSDVPDRIGGLDNAVCFIRLILEGNSGSAELRFDSFTFTRELNYEDVRQEQIKLAEKLGERWGVTPFVGFEISGAGHHKNCFSTKVPVIDYEAHGFKVTEAEAAAHVRKYGGIFAYNHPLTDYSGADIDEDEKNALVEEVAKKFAASRLSGATLVEIGFPEGRKLFSEEHHLLLWDKMIAEGFFINGYGDSDNHHAIEKDWLYGNNFCTFAGLFDSESPNEEGFVSAYKRGSLWTGDPTVAGEISFTADSRPMGSVSVGDSVRVTFSARGFKTDGYAVRVVNGVPAEKIELSDGAAEDSFTLCAIEKYNFARMELRNREGRVIALTNPVYLVAKEEDIPEGVIKERIYK